MSYSDAAALTNNPEWMQRVSMAIREQAAEFSTHVNPEYYALAWHVAQDPASAPSQLAFMFAAQSGVSMDMTDAEMKAAIQQAWPNIGIGYSEGMALPLSTFAEGILNATLAKPPSGWSLLPYSKVESQSYGNILESGGIWTLPMDGVYMVNAGALREPGINEAQCGVSIGKDTNPMQTGQMSYVPHSTTYHSLSTYMCTFLFLPAGTRLGVWIYGSHADIPVLKDDVTTRMRIRFLGKTIDLPGLA